MSAALLELYPQASQTLQIATRAQHICRWRISRQDYPLGRDGYHAWRIACREHHATLISAIMVKPGFSADAIAHVADIVGKMRIKSDPESQALENVVGVVFVRYYLDQFAAEHRDYDEAKLIGILRKTLRKMDPAGHSAVLRLDLPAPTRSLIERALAA